MNTVKVTITGAPGSGKTAVRKILVEALRQAGISCGFHEQFPFSVAPPDEVVIEEFVPRGQLADFAV